MSEISIKRIAERHLAELPAACAEGRGEELLHAFIKDIAVDFAANVFLKMEDVVANASAADAAILWDWVNDFPYQQGLALIDSVTSTMVEFGASAVDLQVQKAETAAVTAYQQRLNDLMETSRAGGAA